MTIDRGDIDSVGQPELLELVDAGVPEGMRLEYKLELYGGSDADKREFLKDVCALANTQGGHIVLGIREERGVAEEVVGVQCEDADAEILRMEQLSRSGLDPAVPGIRFRAIDIASGRRVFLVRVPRSWHPPHRVSFRGSNRYFARHSAGVYEPSVEELRALFMQSTEQLERAAGFRNQRVGKIAQRADSRPLVGSGSFILHIVPSGAFSGQINLDVERVYENHRAFRPIGSMGMSPSFNFDGFVNERGGAENFGYTQVYRNGCIEATKADIVREHEGSRGVSGLALERCFFEVLPGYVNALSDLGVSPPLVVLITLEGVQGAIYHVVRNLFREDEQAIPDDPLYLPVCVIEDYGEDINYHRAVRPAFDALWNATGRARSLFFNEDGLWVGEVQR